MSWLLSLKGRSAFLLILYLVVSLVVISATGFRAAKRHVREEARREALRALEQFAAACHGRWEPGMPMSKNRHRMDSSGIERRLAVVPQVVYAAFQNTAGEMRYVANLDRKYEWMLKRSKFRNLQERSLQITGSAERVFMPSPSDVVREFSLKVRGKNGEDLGIVRIGIRESGFPPALGRLLRTTAGTLLSAIALTTLCGFALMLLLIERLERPIQKLHRRARFLLQPANTSPPGQPWTSGSHDFTTLLTQEFDGIEELIQRLKSDRSKMVGSLSHEFRTPLQVIQGFANVLRSGEAGPVTPEMEHCLKIIEENSQRFSGFVDNVLDWVLIEEGKLTVKAEPFQAQRIIDSAVDLFDQRAQSQGIRLHKDISGAGRALGNPSRAYQILVSLISNAIKFTPQGGTITVGLRDCPQGIELFVQDTGPGIPRHLWEKVFTEFYQVPNSPQKRGSKGLGLGLTLCKRFAEVQGGSIRVHGADGAGALFCLTLPKSALA